jgi:RHH-type transcriptional regulator, rel operon repressor / antitoxin RelB
LCTFCSTPQTGRTKSYYARQAIVEKIEDLDDIYLAEQTLECIRAGQEDMISADVMWHDLEN